jgi:hypothetical protein
MRAERFRGWVPIRVYWEQNAPFVDWCYLGERRFTDPFFNDTIEQCLRNPANLLFRHHTPIEALAEWRRAQPGLPPKGFIFHMSRCGSTLVAQMLAALSSSVVISEAGPVDSVLRANIHDPTLSLERQAEWLEWVVSAMGQPRSGEEKDLFIKFDCWHAIDLELIHRTFPDVPWIFLYRNPVEVMVSQLKKRSVHFIPGIIDPTVFGLDRAAATEMPPEEYGAITLARICEAALRQRGAGRSLFINYRRLPEAVWTTILDFFHVAYTPDDVERMRKVARLNAKNPNLQFEDDSAAKNKQASEQLIQATERWLAPVYEQLQSAGRD